VSALRSLSLAELEQVRLVLRGGSVVDWYRLRFESLEDVRTFVRISEGDPDEEAELARLDLPRTEAARYLQEKHSYKLPAELLTCDALDLFLYASEKKGRRRDVSVRRTAS